VSAPAGESQKASLGPAVSSPTLFASDVPPEQFVEMRVLSPRELLAPTGGQAGAWGWASGDHGPGGRGKAQSEAR
jgi:hypothetical protein